MPAKHRKMAALAARLVQEGWRVQYRGRHIVFFPANKEMRPVVAGTTTSSWDGATTLVAKFRAAGADVKVSDVQ